MPSLTSIMTLALQLAKNLIPINHDLSDANQLVDTKTTLFGVVL